MFCSALDVDQFGRPDSTGFITVLIPVSLLFYFLNLSPLNGSECVELCPATTSCSTGYSAATPTSDPLNTIAGPTSTKTSSISKDFCLLPLSPAGGREMPAPRRPIPSAVRSPVAFFQKLSEVNLSLDLSKLASHWDTKSRWPFQRLWYFLFSVIFRLLF